MTQPKNRKQSVHLPASKPRNPLVAAVLTRHAGAHGRSEKADRQQQRQRLQQHLGELLQGDAAEFELED